MIYPSNSAVLATVVSCVYLLLCVNGHCAVYIMQLQVEKNNRLIEVYFNSIDITYNLISFNALIYIVIYWCETYCY